MNSNRKMFLIGGVIILLLVLAFAFLMGGSEHNWRETYDENIEEDKKDPYGVFVLFQLLQDYYPSEEVIVLNDSIRNLLPDTTGMNYVFVGGGMYMSTEDSDELIDFVEKGNNAFIVSRSIAYDLSDFLFEAICDTNAYWSSDFYDHIDTSVFLNFTHPSLMVEKPFNFQHLEKKSKVRKRDWRYINPTYFCEEDEYRPAKLGIMEEDMVNFARIDYGAGAFYVHTMPSLFTNIHLLDQSGLDYASRVFSHLEKGTIYWDVHSKLPPNLADQLNYNKGLSQDNPLKYILSQPPLAWAWYLLLAMGFLYLIFRAKRRQRMIPVIEKNENTSLAFVGTIGRMYFLQNNHRHLVLQKMQLFLGNVRERYQLPTHELDDKFAKNLAIRSEVSLELIKKILLMHRNIKGAVGATDNTLIEFHQLIERFWKDS